MVVAGGLVGFLMANGLQGNTKTIKYQHPTLPLSLLREFILRLSSPSLKNF